MPVFSKIVLDHMNSNIIGASFYFPSVCIIYVNDLFFLSQLNRAHYELIMTTPSEGRKTWRISNLHTIYT